MDSPAQSRCDSCTSAELRGLEFSSPAVVRSSELVPRRSCSLALSATVRAVRTVLELAVARAIVEGTQRELTLAKGRTKFRLRGEQASYPYPSQKAGVGDSQEGARIVALRLGEPARTAERDEIRTGETEAQKQTRFSGAIGREAFAVPSLGTRCHARMLRGLGSPLKLSENRAQFDLTRRGTANGAAAIGGPAVAFDDSDGIPMCLAMKRHAELQGWEAVERERGKKIIQTNACVKERADKILSDGHRCGSTTGIAADRPTAHQRTKKRRR